MKSATNKKVLFFILSTRAKFIKNTFLALVFFYINVVMHEMLILRTISPVQSFISKEFENTTRMIDDFKNNLLSFWDISSIKQKNEEYKIIINRQRDIINSAKIYQDFQEFMLSNQSHLSYTVCSIIYRNINTLSYLIVKPVSSQNVKTNSVAISRQGYLVGKISKTDPVTGYAKIQLINNKNFYMPVVSSLNKSYGIIKGDTFNKGNVEMEFLDSDGQDVAVGDEVFTSGEEFLSPRLIPVGEVIEKTNKYAIVKVHASLNTLSIVSVVNQD